MYREEEKKNALIFLLCIVLTVLSAVALLWKFDFVYVSNDDELLKNIISGAFTGKPEAHMIHTMYPLGLILKGLYVMFPHVSWYDVFIVGLDFLCMFLVTFRMGTCFKQILNRFFAVVITAVLFVVFQMNYIVMHQYTALSAITAATALLWLITIDLKEKRIFDGVIVITMFILSLWIRKESFLLSMPLAVLALLVLIFDCDEIYDERFYRFKRLIVPLIIALSVAGISFLMEYVAYSPAEWRAYRAFNGARTVVYDYQGLPDYDTNVDFYDSIDMTEAEYTALREYDVILLDRMNPETFKALSDRADEVAKEWARYYSVPRRVINETVAAVFGKNKTPLAITLTVLFFMLFVYLLVNDERFLGVIAVMAYAYQWCFIGYFTHVGRLLDRITHSFFLLEILFITGIFIRVIRKKGPMKAISVFWMGFIFVLLVILIGTTSLYVYRNTSDTLQAKQGEINRWIELNRYFANNPDKTYVVDSAVYAAAGDYMFADNAAISKNVLITSYALGSPHEALREKNNGLDTTVRKTLAESDKVLFVQNEYESIDWLEELFGTADILDTVTMSDGVVYNIINLGQ